MSRNGFAEQLAELISEQVDSIISDYDLSDKIQEELPNFDDLVDERLDKADIDDKVNDAVDEAIKDYDFSDVVEKEIEAELNENLHEYVENEFEAYTKTAKFKELVLAEVNRVLDARDAVKRAKMVDYLKFGPLRRWVAAKYNAWGSWY